MTSIGGTLAEEGDRVTQLLEDELGGMMFAPSTNSITFFSGPVSIDSVRSRVGLMVESNPWLLSNLVKLNSDDEVVAKYCLKPGLSELDCFTVLDNPCLSSTLPYDQLLKEVSDVLVPIGVSCVDKREPLWRVTLYVIKPELEYALVVSLSHVMGDGHTFYTLYSMLSCDAPIRTLEFDRHHAFGDQLIQCVGKPLQDWIYSPYFGQGIANTLQRAAPSVCAYTINKTEIQRLKGEVIEGFVSTNDILVSWFCRLCQTDYGLMVVNFRNRVEGLTNEHIGNYHKILVYSPDQYQQAVKIRQSLPSFNKGGQLPTQEQTLEFNVAMVTNWSAYYRDIQLCSSGVSTSTSDKIQQLAHIPLLKAGNINFRDCCVIFQSDRHTLAVMLFTRSAVDIPALVAAEHPSVKLLDKKLI